MRVTTVVMLAIALVACGKHSNHLDRSNETPAPGGLNLAMFAPAPSKEIALKIMHERHEGMEGIGKSNKLIKQELNASSPNLDLVRYTASRMVSASKDANGWFAKGTGPELGKTGAKPEIWENEQDVATKLAAFQKAVHAFETNTRGNNVVAMKVSFASLSGTCKACHDKYRSEMHHH
jgi:cytochrome c556